MHIRSARIGDTLVEVWAWVIEGGFAKQHHHCSSLHSWTERKERLVGGLGVGGCGCMCVTV